MLPEEVAGTDSPERQIEQHLGRPEGVAGADLSERWLVPNLRWPEVVADLSER